MSGGARQRSETKKYRLRPLFVMLILLLLIAVSSLWYTNRQKNKLQSLFNEAVSDAVMAESREIEPLVELRKDNPLTTWDTKGRVLLLSWHSNPKQYEEGTEITLENGPVWTFTDAEIAAWYEKNKSSVTDWDLRLEQLIGLPPDAGYTHVSAFLVNPENVLRPAYVTDITSQMSLIFPEGTDPAYMEWFEENVTFSYEESAYPWTRLGYTYDWADNGTEYGLTEFLIEENAAAEIAFTKTTKEFINWLEQGMKGE